LIYLKAASIYQVVAGLVGLISTVRTTSVNSGSGVTFNVIAVALSVISVVLGVSLWSGNERATRWSFWWQVLQIPRLTSPVLTFAVLVGLEFTVRLQGPLMSLFWQRGVTFVVWHPAPGQAVSTTVGINVVAGTAAFLVSRGRRALFSRVPVTISAGVS
jgi:hypothetical protein